MPPKTSPKRVAHRRQRPEGWRPWDLPLACKPGVAVRPKDRERLRASVKVDMYDCWVTDRTGMDVSGVRHTMHQAAWRIYKSDGPPRFIATSCGVDRCVNPQHLIGDDSLCTKGLHPMAPENRKPYTDGRILCLACHTERWSKCKRGHDLDEVGHRLPSGYRVCSTCANAQAAAHHAANREKRLQQRREKYRSMPAEEKEAMLALKREQYRSRKARMSLEERAKEARVRAERMRKFRARQQMSDPQRRMDLRGNKPAEGRTA